MTKSLVGFTGFVGSNLLMATDFDYCYNSKNIKEAYSTNPDLLVYAGVPAEMFLANKDPEKDFEVIKNAIYNIKNINPKKIVLISTVAVYSDISVGDEDTLINKKILKPYGLNRLYLEEWVEKNFDEFLIVRLPALYGANLKKNFIYDYINVVPKLLNEKKFLELSKRNDKITNYYALRDNGFYECKFLTNQEKNNLVEIFKELQFSALNFTDSRNEYQFYNLKNLWKHINIALENNIKKINLVTEPIAIGELYIFLENKVFKNEISDNVFTYNLHTKYSSFFNSETGYIEKKSDTLADIRRFVKDAKKY